MTMRKLLFVTLLAGAAAPLHAVDDAGNYAIWGQGARSCNQFSKAAGGAEYARYKDYVMGYLTAYNMLSEATYSVTADQPLKQIMARLALHCDDNKLDSFDRALKMLVDQQYPDRRRSAANAGTSWGRAPNAAE